MTFSPPGTGSTSTGSPGRDDAHAVWDGHPDEDYRRDMSHWRGHGRWPEEQWAAIDASTVASLRRSAGLLGRDVPAGPMLE